MFLFHFLSAQIIQNANNGRITSVFHTIKELNWGKQMPQMYRRWHLLELTEYLMTSNRLKLSQINRYKGCYIYHNNHANHPVKYQRNFIKKEKLIVDPLSTYHS